MTDYITLSLQRSEARDLMYDLKYARKLSLMNVREQLDNAMNRTVEIEGWKGKDDVEFIFDVSEDVWKIIEHRKDKVTGQVKTNVFKLPDYFVGLMWNAIEKQCEVGVNYTCYQIAALINWDWKELWKERRQYFKAYYYPIKVLQFKGFVSYDSWSKIRRLK